MEAAFHNRILALLPLAEQRRIQPHLQRSWRDVDEELIRPGATIEAVHFLDSGVASLVSMTGEDERNEIEIATIGNEGVLGVPVFLGATSSPTGARMRIAGHVWSTAAEDFRREIAQLGTMRSMLQCYIQALFDQIAQGAACNRAHDVQQRCARWLLMTHDRVGRQPQFPISPEFLARMLGESPSTVARTMAELGRAGALAYANGIVDVRARETLERLSCRCYGVIAAVFDRMVPTLPV